WPVYQASQDRAGQASPQEAVVQPEPHRVVFEIAVPGGPIAADRGGRGECVVQPAEIIVEPLEPAGPVAPQHCLDAGTGNPTARRVAEGPGCPAGHKAVAASADQAVRVERRIDLPPRGARRAVEQA